MGRVCLYALCCVLLGLGGGAGEVLTPPYFNLAEGRRVTATATCGDEGPEMYCKLVGAQVCDFCDMNNPSKRHPPEYAVDGMETWWQSPPLSRSMKYNEVSFTIDLGQEFHVAYVFVRMGNSPRPGLWALEKSSDYGKTYKPWQYFSDSASDCETYFNISSDATISADDSVICNMEYSKIVPLEGGEIPISLLNNRPSASKYFNSSVLQEWTRATNVRLRFIKTKTLLGHLMSVARQDSTVTRRYFYSIKDISIGGRCMCNGHADLCDIPDAEDPKKLLCRCQHHTCGPQCNYCCPGFQQKAWRQSQNWQKFHCEPCNCFNHSTECEYSAEVDAKHLSLDMNGRLEGGGVCKNCQHNTKGINCNMCKDGYYRPHGKMWNETDVCQPCNCHYHYSTGNCAEGSGLCECREEYKKPLCDACNYGFFGYPHCKPCTCNQNGTTGDFCEPRDGICPCKKNYAGIYCQQCSDGHYNFPECQVCKCDEIGSLTSACDQVSGNCTCKNSYSGRSCEQCAPGYYNYPACSYCNCDTSGTLPGICDAKTGECLCKEGFGGARCDQCVAGYYSKLVDRERVCVPCECSTNGSTSLSCDANGKCTCIFNFAGTQCNQCSPGYYNYPDCLACQCDSLGSIGVTCDSEGQCNCKENFATLQCNVCKEGFYNYPACEECNCDPGGVVESFAGCDAVPAGELCKCKERVQGRICNQCKPLYYDLQQYNPLGCTECECNVAGTQGHIGVCDTKSGQCVCKHAVDSRRCGQCKDGTYGLSTHNVFGCVECNCDIGGAVNNVCHKGSGQCTCKPRIEGQRCDKPLLAHYFPTLYQYQFEAEDAETLSGGPVRAGSSTAVFPDFSWKGYASFSVVQDHIIQQVYIQKASVYRMVMRYVNPSPDPIVATILITPDNSNEIEQQKFDVLLKPTTAPELVTVSGAQGSIISPLVMNPGIWTITIKTTKNLHLDYFVLLPAAYYEAPALTHGVETPCTIGDKGLCLHFGFPNVSQYDSVKGAGGYTSNQDSRDQIYQFITNPQQLKELGVSEIPLITSEQRELILDVTVTKLGGHVMLVEYATPVPLAANQSSGSVNITARGGTLQETAQVHFDTCPYSFLCRQVVTDDLNRIQIFDIQDNFIGLTLKGDKKSNVAINSIVLIPYSQWHMDYITPNVVCVRRNNTCLHSEFPIAPDSKKVEFESPDLVSISRPPVISDNTTQLIYLDVNSTHVDITSKVPFPGQFVFIVHYYQPYYPESQLEALIQNGQMYEGSLPIRHCPSNSGCRSVIQTPDGNSRFTLTENFVLTLSAASGSVWLDSLIIVPAEDYTDSLLKEMRVDQSKEFIAKCGQNHFYVDINQEGFCRDATFSLTSDYNNGALPCGCDYEGSLSFECSAFGGQCQCKDNVIGRRCEACKTGYYGFPDCKPCDCPPTATCEKETGECKCATFVTGEKCDRCEPLTFGFDPTYGCMECDCSPQGVVANQLQCDLTNGSCSCKENVEGRTCDHCADGFHSFPYCESCYCNVNGTTPLICDKDTATCFCKEHVMGEYCDTCREGTYDLQEENPLGCTKCFCFGKTTRCDSANMYWAPVKSMEDWVMVNMSVSQQNITVMQYRARPSPYNRTSVDFQMEGEVLPDHIVYFGAPDVFLGNKLKSYGGILEYKIFYTNTIFGRAIAMSDVILRGADTWLVHNSIEQPAASVGWLKRLPLREAEFRTLTGVPATRDLLMTVLEKLQGVFIRATYWEHTVYVRLEDVSLQEAVPYYKNLSSLELASSVEECSCPINYKGSSCEECAEGFYRVASGPHGGYCVPCQCNNHADTCDVHTGKCYDCQHNTRGDYCEQCVEGYHGNATIGTPVDCLICACPLPISSNNFAVSCEVSSDGEYVTCDCKEGYFGARCESCDSGFFGRPERPGDTCQPCNCSGNINPEDPESCDTVTGECLKCMNNTFGDACALCEPGFYGDAIILKDCQECFCDKLGMEECDSYTGQCVCKPGVIGDKCDSCEVEHWGFESGEGCKACNCSVASKSKQCDDTSGQCICQPGVTGKMCDRCASGFWDYTPNGCESCGCNSEYSVGFGCNALTGHCECLPGVVGDKCDRCPYRWVLVAEEGCIQCDVCQHSLLNSTDHLQALIDPVMVDFEENKASGYFTAQRLVYIKKLMQNLLPQVQGLDPTRFDLTPLNKSIATLENEIKALDRKAEYGASDAERLKKNAASLHEESLKAMEDTQGSVLKVNWAVTNVWELANNLELETQQNLRVDSALAEARQLLSDIKAKNLSDSIALSQNTSEHVADLQRKVNRYLEPVDEQSKKYNEVKDSLGKVNGILHEAQTLIEQASEKAKKAENLNKDQSHNRVTSLLELVRDSMESAVNTSQEATGHLLNASYALNDAKKSMNSAGQELNEVFAQTNTANETIHSRGPRMAELRDLTLRAREHLGQLKAKSAQLNHLLETCKNNSEIQTAVQGASAYRDIAMDLADAMTLAQEANQDNTEVQNMVLGMFDRLGQSTSKSNLLHSNARDALEEVQGQLRPTLQVAQDNVANLTARLSRTQDTNSGIDLSLKSIDYRPLSQSIEEATQMARQANETAAHLKNLIGAELLLSMEKSVNQSRELPKEVDNTEKNIQLIDNEMKKVSADIPSIARLMDEVSVRKDRLEQAKAAGQAKVAALRSRLAMARDVAGRIRLGVDFQPSTHLQLQTPANVEDLATNTHVSLYFRTPVENSFLLYLGNQEGTRLRRTKRDDFMALEVVKGYPTLTMDLGDGPVKITNDKFVADDTWYQVIVDRVGRHVELTIREELPGGEVVKHSSKQTLPGDHTIFNLDSAASKLYVGGYPATQKIQDSVEFSGFQGQVEELVIGDTPVGLWNFVEAQNNRKGVYSRNKLRNLEPSTGYSYNGKGYTILSSSQYRFKESSDVYFKFKTFAKDGLLFLVGNGQSFMSVEMRDGQIYFQLRLGGDVLTLGTDWKEAYNDGKWHTVSATRYQREAQLTVDEDVKQKDNATGDRVTLDKLGPMYFGGYPNSHNYIEVINKGFDGCIDDVVVSGTTVDLSQNSKSFGVTPGCPVKFSGTVSFEQGGYLKKPNVSRSNDFECSVRFKTSEKEGLILYATDATQSTGISLSLVDGVLVMLSQEVKMTSGTATYNDDQWHTATIKHNDKTFGILVDDFDFYTSDLPPAPQHFLYGFMYIGGLPQKYAVSAQRVATTRTFQGCLSDATLHGEVINFANSTEKFGETLGKCARPGDAPTIHEADVDSEAETPVKPLPPIARLPPPQPPTTRGPPPVSAGPRKEVTSTSTTTSTTAVPPHRAVPPTEKKKPEQRCGLYDASRGDGNLSEGFRFGARFDSRVEFGSLPHRMDHGYEMAVDFNTTEGGLIFYAHQYHKDYIALYMLDGKLTFTFTHEAKAMRVSSGPDAVYNDGAWHSVSWVRQGDVARLLVDSVVVGEGGAPQPPPSLSSFSLGGVQNDTAELRDNLENWYEPFNGCLKNFRMNGRPVTDVKNKVGTYPCSVVMEKGVYFGGSGGYLKLFKPFKVSRDLRIKLDIKPRTHTGLLLSVHGKMDYLVVELVNDTIVAKVNNKKSVYKAEYNLGDQTLCDGNWHSITVVKSKYVLTVGLNGRYSQPGVGSDSVTNTHSALFVGGHIKISKLKGSQTNRAFAGCIRNLEIASSEYKIVKLITPADAFEDAHVGLCPVD